MKKNDFIIVAVLVALMFGWMKFYPALEKNYFPRPEQPVEESRPEAPVSQDAPPTARPALQPDTAPAEEIAAAEQPEETDDPLPPETVRRLSDDQMELTVSSHGGAVLSAVLFDYPAENRADSGPLVIGFEESPALRYDGLRTAGEFADSGNGLVYTASAGDGNLFKRTLELTGNYLIRVEDTFINNSDQPWMLPAVRLPTGPMENPAGTTSMRGLSTLGVDTFTVADGVTHWGKPLAKIVRDIPAGSGLVAVDPAMIPSQATDWVAAKNKFFVQILTPQDVADGFDVSLRREGEGKKAMPVEVAAALQFRPEVIAPGEQFSRTVRAYIGPKDFDVLKQQGLEQSSVMEFKSTGFWSFMNPVMYPIKLALLWGLTHFAVFGNYGIAILILTVLVRVLFWPLTHKGTESMKRMQALQPKIKELREKYKDNPQRMQQETMALYKEHKVNPMGGCLPMFVQIPVFIALFTVLRSAIELRFSKFLWVQDLSEPENLFQGMIPVVGSLNILPILMAATMMWQQKLTPTAGDAQQQKMMAVMMPVMMLFFFYGMPSGLVLYWTTSQVLMIVQMLIKRKKEA
jgi:YidC/Oxa1 family membrane protein insertase